MIEMATALLTARGAKSRPTTFYLHRVPNEQGGRQLMWLDRDESYDISEGLRSFLMLAGGCLFSL
jgi:hypothetical protein